MTDKQNKALDFLIDVSNHANGIRFIYDRSFAKSGARIGTCVNLSLPDGEVETVVMGKLLAYDVTADGALTMAEDIRRTSGGKTVLVADLQSPWEGSGFRASDEDRNLSMIFDSGDNDTMTARMLIGVASK